MPRGTERFLKAVKQQADVYYKVFTTRYGQQIIDLLELPVKVVLSPFTLAYDIAGSAPRGFGIPELASHLSFSAIFVVATLGTYDIALELGRKVICQRNCRTCNGWQALRCTMCKGTGKVHYQVKNYSPKSGEKATTECVAEAIVENRAELVHLPATINLSIPLPSKDCLNCDGSGVMGCPDCKRRLQVRISADDIMEPPWKAYNVITKMDYPYENIVHSMRDPKIAAFWLITMPQVLGGFNYDDDVKQKIWWAYKESMRYDQLRDAVAKRKSGWEHLQDMPPSMVPTLLDAADSPLFNVGVVAPSIIGGLPITVKPLHSYFNSQALISLDPVRARDDPVIVKNIPFYKAKKELEAEVMKLDVPRRPQNWGELDLPLNASSWTEEDLKDPKKLLEMTTLLNAQREIADKILDAQWEAKWRQDKKKTTTRRRWWFF